MHSSIQGSAAHTHTHTHTHTTPPPPTTGIAPLANSALGNSSNDFPLVENKRSARCLGVPPHFNPSAMREDLIRLGPVVCVRGCVGVGGVGA